MCAEPVRCSCDVVLERRAGQAYNEEAFRHFLAIERKRAERSQRPTFLVLIRVMQQTSDGGRIGPVAATKIFAALCHGLREVDVIGWFREDRVVGAVLGRGATPSEPDTRSRITHRIAEVLDSRVPAVVARRLHVRVVQLPPVLRG
jgi:hypothetical protein